jgi:hypothetical protein
VVIAQATQRLKTKFYEQHGPSVHAFWHTVQRLAFISSGLEIIFDKRLCGWFNRLGNRTIDFVINRQIFVAYDLEFSHNLLHHPAFSA